MYCLDESKLNYKEIELAGMSNTVVVQGGDTANSQNNTLHDSGHAIFHFAHFTVNTQHNLLLENGSEVAIEPKVFDLLVYLCRNANRYVLVSELHEHVWADRVVSDAAVRRAISKLRNLLGGADNHSLVKSVHKRGYKIDCEVTFRIEHGSTPPKSSIAQEHPLHSYDDSSKQVTSTPNSRIIVLLFIFSAMLISGFLLYLSDSQKPLEKKFINFSGEKISASANENASAIAFAAKLVGEQGFQLFHANLETSFIRQMTQNANNVTEVKYSHNQASIIFVDLALGASKILNKEIDSDAEPSTLVDGFSIISDFEESHDGSGLYFTAVKDVQGTGQVYYLDYASRDIEEVTVAHDTDSNDYRVDISPNGEYLLVTTSISGLEEHVLSLYNTRNRAIIKRFFHGRSFYEVTWLNDEEIMLLDSNEIVTIDIDGETKDYIGPNPDNSIIDIEPLSNGNFMAVRKSISESYFIEVDLPSFDTATQKIIATPNNSVIEVRYAEETAGLIYLIKEGERSELMIRKNGEPISLLQTTMSLDLLDVSANDDFVLVTLNSLLALLEINTNSVQYITSGSQMVAQDAVFNAVGNSVIYGVKERGVWSIKEYQISSQRIVSLFEGYKSARMTQGEAFLIDENNKLSVYNFETQMLKALNYTLPPAENTNWYADSKHVYFSDFDGKDTNFTVLNHDGLVISEKTFNASSISASFDINPSRSKALLKSWPYSEAEILLLNRASLSRKP